MKKILLIFFIFGAAITYAQKEQDCDTLLWNGQKYTVNIDAYVPSVVTVYFQRTGQYSPFNFWSSNNNRGHIATLEIINEELTLKNIEAKRFKTRKGNLWTETGIDTVAEPEYFGITSLNKTEPFDDDMIIADWYSGILELVYIPVNPKEQKSNKAKGRRYLYIVKGKILENTLIQPQDKTSNKKNANQQQPEILEMQRIQKAFQTFYTRCASDREIVIYNGHKGLLDHIPNGLSLAMKYYNNDPLEYYEKCHDGKIVDNAPFGEWQITGDSLFLNKLEMHTGLDLFSHKESNPSINAKEKRAFTYWITGDYVIHYGVWDTNGFGIPTYTVAKTQKIRIKEGRVVSSSFSPSGFDEEDNKDASFDICNEGSIWSVDDKQLAESIGEYPRPKKSPTYKGNKEALRNWFLNHPLTDDRAKERLFRVRLGFLVNCKGEAGQWRVISKGKGELFEFANMVKELVETLPQNWEPATDKKGNPLDCWQILEFTVSDGILTNANYK
ncbi:MAG: hypothetical protein K6D59_00225 [Bacteroidales bacterium]|nr:hypothetical protein [Bacteroidales bacterium]